MEVLTGVEFTKDFWWTVEIGFENCPSVRFHTDPTGAREVFRLRDVPPGKKRRTAIRHWVSGHWRRRRKDEEERKRWIAKYLRGATKFSWQDLRCVVRPSPWDIREARRLRGVQPEKGRSR